MLEAFLISVLALCVANTLLAVLVVMADATIGNYGRVTLTVNGSRKIEVAGGQSLLATLKDEGIFVPSACGGRSTCGLCKLRLAEGGEPLPTELPWLTPEERKQGARLACQVKVKGDLALFIPESLLSVTQFQTEVAAMRDLTHDIKEIKLKLLEPLSIAFVPGQFIQLEVPPYALTSEPIYRAYSVSSDPIDAGMVELEIRYVPNGICTTYVHKHLKVGDRVVINGPHGEFRLHEGDGEIILIAGGSGMAPMKAILLAMARTGNPRPTRYFFGVRSRRDLFLAEEMGELERRMPNFKFIPALSAPQPGDNWTGETGLITEVVARQVTEVEGRQAYLCGSPLMIDACINVLRAKGLPESRIFFDKFS
ncbi:MAG: 2Fe-2S iron-sulfur cluster binding domain-containing protein [Kiritimatiellae bacterium]|nr:2Fe-2S iron-sulfur cluster binding domain-containing protein [Kiritimatiellia bacterium]